MKSALFRAVPLTFVPALALATSLLHAGDRSHLIELETPSPGRLERLSISDSLQEGSWIPVARSVNKSWETVYPKPLKLQIAEAAPATAQLPLAETPVFFRFESFEEPLFSNAELASRFLQQATFGPTLEAIRALEASGNAFGDWIEQQMALTPTRHSELFETFEFENNFPVSHEKGIIWCHGAISGPDQLRQRMAWALSQIFVVGELGSQGRNQTEEWLVFYDIFVDNAFGNFRDLLQQVTLSPKMGEYLTYVNNRKASGVRKPDENYAREVMQLFTIGLWQLNPDGSLVHDANGEAIPTYSNADIETHARVFTGLTHAPKRDEADGINRLDPMVPREDFHDTESKTLFDGTFLPAGRSTMEDVSALLDRLFLHPNTPPFVSRLLIQRLVCSNPSPGFIARVASVFRDNGSGQRGDLGATLRAILLDPEARSAALAADDGHGALREPLIRFLHLCRAFRLSSNRDDGAFLILDLENDIKQFPYNSFSVFNFYLPDHQPTGPFVRRGLFAPEFQILDEPSAVRGLNLCIELVRDGLFRYISNRGAPQGQLDFTSEIAMASDASALIDHLDLVLTAGRLSPQSRQIILEAVEQLPATAREDRVKRALVLLVATPEFAVIQ